jgi:phosphoribosylaminoimidazole-succinocarboxamide synthase
VGEHDEPVTPDEIIARGLLSAAQWQAVSRLALALFARGREMAAARGLILVDTKYEFGLDAAGRIILADEIHTPDSSRYWFAETYPARFAAGQPPDAFDKDVLRRWVAARCDPYRDEVPPIPPLVVAQTAAVYIDAYERITGENFVVPPPGQGVLDRIRANLRSYF